MLTGWRSRLGFMIPLRGDGVAWSESPTANGVGVVSNVQARLGSPCGRLVRACGVAVMIE